MIEPSLPANESARLRALHDYAVLDTEAEQAYDDMALLASRICGTPIALVSLVDEHRQWFKAKVGLEAVETPRRVAFCAHAISEPQQMLVVADARADERFADNPLVTGEPRVRFYAGAPLIHPDGHAMGTLCVIDHQPRSLTAEQTETLQVLARRVISELELRRKCVDLELLTAELRQSYKELDEFTAIAAHDLQAPARKIVTFSRMLREDVGQGLSEDAGKDLDFLEASANRMRGLITDLLELSRAGSGAIELRQCEIGACVDQAVIDLRDQITATNAKVSIDEMPSLRVDRTLVTQLFQNLIGNALKFMRDVAAEIHVTSTWQDGEWVFGVRDNGVGIEHEYFEQIFKPFRRLHGCDQYAGSGIGLSIVRKAVERHGGRIWVESKPAQGSHFRFTLAAAQQIPAQPVPCEA